MFLFPALLATFMMRNLTQIINNCLSSYPTLIPYKLSQEIHDYFQGFYILESDDSDFDLHEFVRAGKAFAEPADEMHTVELANWTDEDSPVWSSSPMGLFDVIWREHRFKVLLVLVGEYQVRRVIISDSAKVAHEFFYEVCLHGYTARAELLVHANGCFFTDEKLYEQIRDASLDDLTLSPELRAEIEENILNFFDSEETYDRYKVPWKRGVLLTGPPGNGKTQTIKAVIARTKLPSIYVRNFQSRRESAAEGISKVFKRARDLAPCVLVMEDLDSLIDRNCLSFLLNELDGFADNRGVLILATSNHPEKLDPALTERPSRFDRKIKFDLPGPEERFEYLRTRSALHPDEMAVDEQELFEIAQLTEGFTFAYLKELDLSATMRFSRAPMESAFGQCLRELVKPLKSQMKTDQKIPVAATNVD